MNPFQAIMGRAMPQQQPTAPMMGGPFGMLQGALQQAQQLASRFTDPQQMVQQFFPNAPAEVRGDPDQLANWMQQSGMVTPQMVQMARQMIGGR